MRVRPIAEPDEAWAYAPAGSRDAAGEVRDEDGNDLDLALTPYHAWGNRGPVTMRIWLPAPSARSGHSAH